LTSFLHDTARHGPDFGFAEAPRCVTAPIGKARFSVSRLHCEVAPGEARVLTIPAQDAYFVMLYLADVAHCDVLHDGLSTETRRYPQGSICLVNLEGGAVIRLCSTLDSLGFIVPRALFEELDQIAPGTSDGRLECRRGESDAVIANLGTAFLAMFDRGQAPLPVTFKHMAIALCGHLPKPQPFDHPGVGHCSGGRAAGQLLRAELPEGGRVHARAMGERIAGGARERASCAAHAVAEDDCRRMRFFRPGAVQQGFCQGDGHAAGRLADDAAAIAAVSRYDPIAA
jgi:hypothetical protein